MSACCETYSHEFISCYRQPSEEKAIFLCEAIKALQGEDDCRSWVEVFVVYRGEVYWHGWGEMVDSPDGGFMAKPFPEKLTSEYGVDELPSLGHATGYLIRHVQQDVVGCYGPEFPIDKPFPEVVRAKHGSLADFIKMAEWVTK